MMVYVRTDVSGMYDTGRPQSISIGTAAAECRPFMGYQVRAYRAMI